MQTVHNPLLVSRDNEVSARRSWTAPFAVSLIGWSVGAAAALSVGGWMGMTIGVAASLGAPALWMFGEILFDQD